MSDKSISSENDEAKEVLKELKDILNKAIKIQSELLKDTDSTNSLSAKIRSTESGLDESVIFLKNEVKEIKEIHNKLFVSTRGAKSLSSEINEKFNDITDKSTEITKILSKLDPIYKIIFGSRSNDGIKKDSLDLVLKNKLEKLDVFYDEQNKKSADLFINIDSILAGATNIELSKAFADTRKKFYSANRLWTFLFILSICSMLAVSYFTLIGISTIQEAGVYTITKLPLFLPLIWLALFSSRQQSQNKRLEQEYAHKETLAKSFEGYKRQINDLGEQDSSNI